MINECELTPEQSLERLRKNLKRADEIEREELKKMK